MKPNFELFSSKLISGKIGSNLSLNITNNRNRMPYPNRKSLQKAACGFRSFSKIFQEILNNEGYLNQFYTSLMNLFEKEGKFIKKCLSGLRAREGDPASLKKGLFDNLFVFKENLKLCMPIFLDDFFQGYFALQETEAKQEFQFKVMHSELSGSKNFKNSIEKRRLIHRGSTGNVRDRALQYPDMADLLSERTDCRSKKFFPQSSIVINDGQQKPKDNAQKEKITEMDPASTEIKLSKNSLMNPDSVLKIKKRSSSNRIIRKRNKELIEMNLSGSDHARSGSSFKKRDFIDQSKVTEKLKNKEPQNSETSRFNFYEEHIAKKINPKSVKFIEKKKQRRRGKHKKAQSFYIFSQNDWKFKNHKDKIIRKKTLDPSIYSGKLKNLTRFDKNWPNIKISKPDFASRKNFKKNKLKTQNLNSKSGQFKMTNFKKPAFKNNSSRIHDKNLFSIFSKDKTGHKTEKSSQMSSRSRYSIPRVTRTSLKPDSKIKNVQFKNKRQRNLKLINPYHSKSKKKVKNIPKLESFKIEEIEENFSTPILLQPKVDPTDLKKILKKNSNRNTKSRNKKHNPAKICERANPQSELKKLTAPLKNSKSNNKYLSLKIPTSRASKTPGNLSFCLTKKNNKRNHQKNSFDLFSKAPKFDFDMMKQTFSRAPSHKRIFPDSNKKLENKVEFGKSGSSGEIEPQEKKSSEESLVAQKIKHFEF